MNSVIFEAPELSGSISSTETSWEVVWLVVHGCPVIILKSRSEEACLTLATDFRCQRFQILLQAISSSSPIHSLGAPMYAGEDLL